MRVGDLFKPSSELENSIARLISDTQKRREEVGLPLLDANEEIEKFLGAASSIKRFVGDTSMIVNNALNDGQKILAEGAQGSLLDIDHGMYPYVTSSHTIAGQVFTGLGIDPREARVIGVVKSVHSHVGDGPCVSEIKDKETLARLHGDKTAVDAECGTTTGRERRLGAIDLPGIRRGIMLNGVSEIAVTKLDWLTRFDKIPICTGYIDHTGKEVKIAPSTADELKQCTPIIEEFGTWSDDISHIRDFKSLPMEARKVVWHIEKELGKPITMIGVGPERDALITK